MGAITANQGAKSSRVRCDGLSGVLSTFELLWRYGSVACVHLSAAALPEFVITQAYNEMFVQGYCTCTLDQCSHDVAHRPHVDRK